MFTYSLPVNDSGRFGVDSRGNLFKASNETNYETDKSHTVKVHVTDNGIPPLEVSMPVLFTACNNKSNRFRLACPFDLPCVIISRNRRH